MSPNRLLLGIALLALAAAFQGEPTFGQSLKDYTVEIRTQDEKLIGCGTSISFSGLILTAKHVLEDGTVSGGKSPNYRLSVLIGRHQDTGLEPAKILAVHPFLDLAILELQSERPIPAMQVGDPAELAVGDEVIVIGHDIDYAELYRLKPGSVDEVARNGKIVISRNAPRGTSGGPVIKGDKLVAVVESTTIDQITVVPFGEQARDYFELVGITIEGGFASRSDSIAKLANRARTYEALLLDAQQDVAWFAEVRSVENPATDLSIELSYRKRLSMQPDFWATIEGVLRPKFDPSHISLVAIEERIKVMHSGVLKSPDAPYVVKDIVASLIGKIQAHAVQTGRPGPPPNLTPTDLVGFDLAAKVTMIGANASDGKGPTFIDTPKPRHVCFSIRRDPSQPNFADVGRVGNVACPEPLLQALNQP